MNLLFRKRQVELCGSDVKSRKSSQSVVRGKSIKAFAAAGHFGKHAVEIYRQTVRCVPEIGQGAARLPKERRNHG